MKVELRASLPVNRVSAISADHSHQEPRRRAAGDYSVRPPVGIEAYLLGFRRKEAPAELGAGTLCADADPQGAIRCSLDGDPLRGFGRVQVSLLSESEIEGTRGVGQMPPSVAQRRGEPGAVVVRDTDRHLRSRGGEDAVGRDGTGSRSRQIPESPSSKTGQELPVEVAAEPGEPGHEVRSRVEAHQVRKCTAPEICQGEPFVVAERPIVTTGNRLPGRVVVDPAAAPLVAVPVPIADPQVQESRSEESPDVDPLLRAFATSAQQRIGVDDPIEAGETRTFATIGRRRFIKLTAQPVGRRCAVARRSPRSTDQLGHQRGRRPLRWTGRGAKGRPGPDLGQLEGCRRLVHDHRAGPGIQEAQ